MCQNHNIMQRTFGETIDMPAIVAVRPDPPDFGECSACNEPAALAHGGESYCQDCFDEQFRLCANCNAIVSEDESRSNEDGSDYCESCYHELYFYCDCCDSDHLMDECHTVDHRRWSHICNECHREHFATCADCPTEFCTDDSGGSNADGESICESCAENYFYCESCNETRHCDDYGGNGMCDECGLPEGNDEDDDNCRARKFNPANNTFEKIGSHRKYGVELETSRCPNYAELDGQCNFSAEEDGSIDGLEFVSSVLSGDAGLNSIREFCNRANDLSFAVDNKCGFHAHFSTSDLSDDQLRAVAVAYRLTQPVWQSFASESRRRNTYCSSIGWSISDVINCDDFHAFCRKADRYQWFNLNAYSKHHTLEIRLHSATLDSDKVCNWILAHARFMDAIAAMSVETIRATFENRTAAQNFETICELWNSPALASFYRARAEKFGTKYTQAPLPR